MEHSDLEILQTEHDVLNHFLQISDWDANDINYIGGVVQFVEKLLHQGEAEAVEDL